ncbi:MAG: SDR family NAD(P)-dependent oxidoreductase, partial [Maribacter sp.]
MKRTKIALVTGGSRGLGKNMALRLAEKGLDVLITYHSNRKAAEEVVTTIENLGQQAACFALDTTKTNTFNAFFKEVSDYLSNTYQRAHFDYLVNNAGTGIYTPFLETTEAQFDEMMNIHLKG